MLSDLWHVLPDCNVKTTEPTSREAATGRSAVGWCFVLIVKRLMSRICPTVEHMTLKDALASGDVGDALGFEMG
jgi:hypothetical protein